MLAVMTCHMTIRVAVVEEELGLRLPGPHTLIYTSPSLSIFLVSLLELSCLPIEAAG